MPSKIKNYNWRLVVGILAAVTAVAFVAIKGLTDRLEVHHSTTAIFRDFDRVNQRLLGNVLRARLFALKNYDSFVADLRTADSLCEALKTRVSNGEENEEKQIAVQTDSLCVKVAARKTLFEYFKSENSLIRNSLQFLPTLMQTLPHYGGRHDAVEILADLLRINSFGKQELSDRLMMNLKKLDRKIQIADPSQRAKLLSYKNHTEIVIKATEEREKIEASLAALDLSKDLLKLRQLYDGRYERKSRKAGAFHFALVLICVAGGVLITTLFKKLHHVNADLESLNKNLERLVRVRTNELESALSHISDQKQMLIQSAKMSALGEMAGGVAHEINTPLTAIMLNAEMVQDEAKALANESLLDSISKIQSHAIRISKITRGLRSFSREESADPMADFDLKEVIEDSIAIASERMKSNGVLLYSDLPPKELIVSGRNYQISQIIINLLNNACDAVSSVALGVIHLSMHMESETVVVRVRDNGSGVPAEIEHKIMSPFFTTKEVGKGTGLGLSLSLGIARSHGGELKLNRGIGPSCFELTLPLKNADSVTWKRSA